MNYQPEVSVITPVFNGEAFVERVINTVIDQNFNLEHIIINDCSTDNTKILLDEAAAKYNHIKVIHMTTNSGPVICRNTGINVSKGRFIAFLDADDLWLPVKLKHQIKFMKDKNISFSFTDYRHISLDGNKIGRLLRGPNIINSFIHHTTRYIGCLTVVIDTLTIKKFQFPDISPSVRAEDFLAWSRLINEYGPAIRCPEDLCRYTIVPGSRSSKKINAAHSVWLLYKLENLAFHKRLIYFAIFSIFVSFKKIWYAPRYDKDSII